MTHCPELTANRGFTLTELAVVLVIVAFLIGGMLIPLAAQDDLRRTQETQKTLNDIRDALLGFAAANGRLPCPAFIGGGGYDSNGMESFCDDPNPATACGPTILSQPQGRCSNPHDGLVPGVALGFSPTNGRGYILDAWGNPIRYAISNVTDPATSSASTRFVFTGQNGMRLRQLANLAGDSDLRVCAAAPAAAALALGRCASPETTNLRTNTALAVVYSIGANSGRGGTGIDERHNPNVVPSTDPSYVAPDRVFVFHEPAPAGSPNGEFDDIVLWLSPNILFNRMIAAGRLP